MDEVGGGVEDRAVGTSEAHEEVVSSLLDLQRRLRGEADPDVDAWPGLPPKGRRRRGRPRVPEGGVAVETGSGLGVIAAPEAGPPRGVERSDGLGAGGPAAPADRAAAFEDRLARLERDLDALLASIQELSRLRR
ncbi:MAG TPA: hypothetical protein VNO79_13435 [Actinomycetota bacterium]|nr:hypothetical protein [Actinomycetota bacterium]